MKPLENIELVKQIDRIAYKVRRLIMGSNTDNTHLFSAVQDCGIELYGITNDHYDGFLLWNGDSKKPQIYLDIGQEQDRRLFTLAHELGHLVLEYNWTPVEGIKKEPDKEILSISFREKDKKEDTEDNLERMINEFAGAFLMPKELVNDSTIGLTKEKDKIKRVVDRFKVTEKAAGNRLIMLDKING